MDSEFDIAASLEPTGSVPDRALAELKKLREGRGLTVDRIAHSPSLLSATGTSDPAEALAIIRAALSELGDNDRARALRVDFGLNLEQAILRPPTGREIDYLGDRRSAYATILGYDVKTLSRWSDKTISELRGKLLTDQFDGRIIVAAGVKRRRVTGVEVMQYDQTDTELSRGKTLGFKNPEDTSLPLVLYGFPRDWRPISIGFVVAFLDEDFPRTVSALVADTIIDVGFGHERTPLEIDDGMARCRIDRPRRDQLYGVWWEW
ncbi:hypothetical protein [Luteipulveratus mongoliensis]|uniref:Uncharacterized protein n=1 Tax=Luteipulveratus mongoliensis TaxID=571913 RepID=A0A0K1JNC6_9MICO|nr:hypothetical protein [Luteipulveratus mongoliensis]AKU18196.1 hypothetical protein VV02_24010 [Luteipulveratus mongoliensis]